MAILPSPGQYTIAVRCCPILFQLQENGPDPVISLPYRMIIAVATRSSVLLYDTQQMTPFAIISNIHYTRLTDVTWSSDGRLIAVSSTDGFCSLVSFEPNELGIEYVKEMAEPEESEESLVEAVEEVELDNVLNTSQEKIEKKPSFLEQWTKKFNKCDNEEKSEIEQEKENTNEENVLENTKTQNPASPPAKLIAVRRKPRNGQMNITQFLKSSTTEKTVLKPSPVIIIPEDSLPREPWTNSEDTEETVFHNNQNDVIVIEDDSQDIKLILEDSLLEIPINSEEKMEVDISEIDIEKTKASSSKQQNKCDIKDDLPKEVASFLLSPIQKKRVPLITLSSPKQKTKQ